MADMDPQLWCLIEGETTPFPVPALDVFIDKLKRIIKDQIQIDPAAHRLTLWKPKEVISIRPSDTLAQRIGTPETLSSKFEQLNPSFRVSNVFQIQTPNDPHLDVLVQIPTSTPQDEPPSTQQHLGDTTTLSWLKGLHSKIWGEVQLRPELFRTVTVTQAHYDQLQRRLDEQIHDRYSPEYDGSTNIVRSIKLGFLRSILPANPPRRSDNNEDRVDDDDAPEPSNGDESGMDVDEPEASDDDGSTNDTIFPFTLRFLDLSSLELRTHLSHRVPFPLFIREEYDDISSLVNGKTGGSHGVVIVSGQPGTGKTAYLHLRVIESMIEGRSFLYQDLNGKVYRINESGVSTIHTWSGDDEIVAFIDGDKAKYDPSAMLLNNESVQIILVASPKGANADWTKQASNRGKITKFVTKPWSPHELFLAGVFLHPLDISPRRLKESTLYFGYNPRRCFISASSAQNLEDEKRDIKSRITDVAGEVSNMLQVLESSRRGDRDVSHAIFEISPKNALRYLNDCKFDVVSRWAFQYFLDVYETKQAAGVDKFYRCISGVPDAAALWGIVFERLIFRDLAAIGVEHDFPMRRLSGPIPGQATWTFRGPIPRSDFGKKKLEEEFIDAITHAVEHKNRLHLVPLTRNFAAVDSIVYDPDEVLTCIQVLVSTNHKISVTGLRRIQDWLEHRKLLAKLCPSPRRPWRLIFIVPPSVEESFGLQPFKGDTELGEWAGKVVQYVLGLDVFRKPDDSIG